MNMGSKTPYVPISDFYAGKSIFITGGTGYLGKVLIEKLLYSCPLVDKIYVLVREKSDRSVEQRFKNILELPVFSRLKAERPTDLNKIVPVKGELSSVHFNMSDEDYKTITDNVTIVFHSAATVKFNESLSRAMAINVEGTRNVLQLCKDLKRVDAFVHISTAYSNSNRSVIEEMVYPPPTTIDEVYKVLRKGHVDINAVLNGWLNTYTFTKVLAETLVSENHGDIPTVIVRPSVGSKSEPVPGWVDNWFGPTSIMTPAALGICRVMCSQYHYNLDLIPVDYVCNAILVAAAKAVKSNEVAVLNSCSGSINPISIGDSLKGYTTAGMKEGFNALPFPHLILYTTRPWLITLVTNIMLLFAYVADGVLTVFGKKPRYHKLFSRLKAMQKVSQSFTRRRWLIKSPKTLILHNSLSAEDKHVFPFNPQDIVWEEYIPIYFKGVKKYLLESKRDKMD